MKGFKNKKVNYYIQFASYHMIKKTAEECTNQNNDLIALPTTICILN